MATIFAVSHATIIVGVVAPEHLSVVIGMALLGTTVLNVVSGLIGQVPGAIHISQDVPSAAIGAALLVILADRSVGDGTQSLAEIVILITTAGIMLGTCLILFGMFRLSSVMRYAPRPVVAGFLAGTGYFILIGGLSICLSTEVTWQSLPRLIEAPALSKLMVALAVAAALQAGPRLLPPAFMTGLVMLLAIAVFHAVTLAFSLDTDGWFVVLPESGSRWPPVPVSRLLEIDPSFVLGAVVPLLGMVVLSTVALLMMTSAIETVTRQKMGLDRELKATGVGNLASALLGGVPGYVGAAATLSALRIASGHRATSFIAAGLTFSVFFFGNDILGLLPMPVFAGFLIWLGVLFLRDWLWRELHRTKIDEAAVIVAILLVVATFGLLEGTIFGLLAAGALFVINYSKMDPVRTTLYGNAYLGASEFNPAEAEILEKHGGVIAILKLQGFVFFGSAHRLAEHIERQIEAHGVRHFVIDFGGVTGVDATAMATLWRVVDKLEAADADATFTSVSPRVEAVYARSNFPLGETGPIGLAVSIDEALERYQSIVLMQHGASTEARTASVEDFLLHHLMLDDDMARRLRAYFERIEVPAGTTLIREGDHSRDLFFVQSGQLEIYVGHGPSRHRIRVLAPGTVIGEIAFYHGGRRTTSVQTLGDVVAWRFSSEAAQTVLAEDPVLAGRFHAGLARLLAQRVVANTRLVQMLQA